tara:strand:+ start:11323 stop:12567 length:1245 start_codon:yes stop_codon:yes gene_type:complete
MSSTLYTPGTPGQNQFSNVDLNALASQYAAQNGHDTSALIQRITKSLIYDAAPQQFFDLKLLNIKPFESVKSDEWEFFEMGFGREPVIVTAVVAGGASQVLPVTSVDDVSVDTVIVYPNNQKGTITNVDAIASTITVTAYTGQTLPATAVNDMLANMSPIEADAANSISQYFRVDTVRRFNFVQMMIKAMRFGKMEMFKYKNAGVTSNYLTMQKQRLIQQFRIDLSNSLWNGERGEVSLANGQNAKVTGGLFPTMQSSGSPNVTTTVANLPQALEELALDTEFKALGATRFLYGTPRQIHALSQQYKRLLTRYTPSDDIAKLGLNSIDMGSSKIVFVPMKRFEDPSSFPATWANRLILLDQEAVSCVQTWGEEMGETLPRKDGGSLNNFTDFWISTTFGVQFNNPLGSGWIDIL